MFIFYVTTPDRLGLPRSYLGQKVNPHFFFEFSVLLLGDNNNSVEICRAFYHLLVGMIKVFHIQGHSIRVGTFIALNISLQNDFS